MKKIALLLLISLTYCSGSGAPDTKDAVAVINDRTITLEQFLNQAQNISNTPGVNLSTKNGRVTVLKDMINEELVFQRALAEKYHLKSMDVKHEVVREYLRDKFGKDLPIITDERVRDYYNEHEKNINVIRASHILIGPKTADAKGKAEAKALAQKIRSDIVTKKISFEDAVKKYSTDQGTVDKLGDLDFFPKENMVKPFGEAAYALKNVGDLSPVVETEFGYHIIMLTGDQRGLEKSKERIKWILYQEAIQPKIDAYFNELKEKAQIKIIDSELLPAGKTE